MKPVNYDAAKPLDSLPQLITQLVPELWWPKLIKTGLAVTYKKGTYIIRVGERDKYVRVGLSGWSALRRGDTILGLFSVAMQTNAVGRDRSPATADLIALTEVRAILLDSDTFTDAIMASPHGLLTLLKWSQRNLDRIVEFSAYRAGCTLNFGLPALLWTLGTPMPDGRRKIPSGIPQYALAAALGASREEVNRKKKLLRDTGCLIEDDGEEYLDAMTPMLLMPIEMPGR